MVVDQAQVLLLILEIVMGDCRGLADSCCAFMIVKVITSWLPTPILQFLILNG